MYAVVGCSTCNALWLLEGRQETAQCPRCGTHHRYAALKQFVETDDADHAREVRASMLASRQGHADTFAAVDSFAELETRVDDPVVDDREFLAGSGIDADEAAAASDRAGPGGKPGGSNRKTTVLDAIDHLDDPTEDAIVEYATARGVPAEYVETALVRLVRSGDVSEHRGQYRTL